MRRSIALLLIVMAWVAMGRPNAISAQPRDQARADTQQIQPPKVLFGAFVARKTGQTTTSAITDFESKLGRPLAAVRVYDLWNSAFPDSDTLWMRDTGHAIFLSVKAKYANGTVIPWVHIARASLGSPLYDDIVGWANGIKAFGSHVYFIFNHDRSPRPTRPTGRQPTSSPRGRTSSTSSAPRAC
jgi:hypothetical protein